MMGGLAEQIVGLLRKQPGLSDRQIADTLLGNDAPQQGVNQLCRRLESQGSITRAKRDDGRIGNYLSEQLPQRTREAENQSSMYPALSEDWLKQALQTWLSLQGWHSEVSWAHCPGGDITATRGPDRWLIEVKGCGSLPAMRVNYFLAIVGEILQRMRDPACKYSIALPDLPQFRGLWNRFPDLAKTRTQITALFVDQNGEVVEAK